MIKRDILDFNGNKIGEKEYEDGTSEVEIAKDLAQFSHAPVKVIPDVTPRQIRQAMILRGMSLDIIDSALNSLPEPTKSLALAEWEYSNMFVRNRPLVNQVGHLLGMTSDQLDDLWLFAGSLP